MDTSTEASRDTTAGSGLEDDPFLIVTDEEYEEFAFVVNIVVTPILCSLGLIGNVLGVGVLWRDSKREKLTIYVYLCFLTLLDSVYLFFGVTRSVPNLIKLADRHLANFIEEHMKLGTIYMDMVFTYSATTVILVMAVERLMALTRPFTVKHSWLSKYPRRVLATCFIVNALFFIPYLLYIEVASFENADNRTEYFVQFKHDAVELMDTFTFVHTIIHNYIPCCMVLVVNFAIPIAFSRILKSRTNTLQMNTNQRSQQAKITLTIFCITVFYFLFNMPDLFCKTLAFVDPRYSFDGEYRLSFWLFMDLTNLFTYLNAANDFVIYILVSDHYRKIFKQMYCKPCLGTGASYMESEEGSCRTAQTEGSSVKY